MFKMKKKDSHNKKALVEIRKFALEEIPDILDEIETEQDYQARCRIPLNILIIEYCFGAECKKPKKDGGKCDMKYNHKRPSSEQVAELTKIVDEFVKEVEDPFLAGLVPEDDDMAIPSKDDYAVPTLEKVNKKKIRNYIFGYDGKSSMTRARIVAADIPAIALLGKDVRKNIKRNRMLLVGGIALVITAGVTTAFVVHNMKKKHNDGIDAEMAADLDELDNVLDDIEQMEDDTPSVELGE